MFNRNFVATSEGPCLIEQDTKLMIHYLQNFFFCMPANVRKAVNSWKRAVTLFAMTTGGQIVCSSLTVKFLHICFSRRGRYQPQLKHSRLKMKLSLTKKVKIILSKKRAEKCCFWNEKKKQRSCGLHCHGSHHLFVHRQTLEQKCSPFLRFLFCFPSYLIYFLSALLQGHEFEDDLPKTGWQATEYTKQWSLCSMFKFLFS